LTGGGQRGESLGINATTPPETDPSPPPDPEAVTETPDEAARQAALDLDRPTSRPAAMAHSALEDRSPRFLLGTIALAVVVSLIAGFAIGYKVENSKGTGTKSAKKVAAGKKPKGTKKPHAFTLKAAPQLVGGVFSIKTKQLVVLNADRKGIRIGIGPKTRVAIAAPDKASSIVVGARVLYAKSKTSATKTTDVVVLPPTAKIGVPVTAVVPGTSMTLKSLTGKDTVITTTGATVVKTKPGTRRNIAKGDRVIVYYYVVRGKRNAATEVVVLPSGSKFT
jgi:hypothetical protein